MSKFEIADVESALKKIADENKVIIIPAYTIQPLIQVSDLEHKPVDKKIYQKVLKELNEIEIAYEIGFVIEPRLSIRTKNEPIEVPKTKTEPETKETKNTKA